MHRLETFDIFIRLAQPMLKNVHWGREVDRCLGHIAIDDGLIEFAVSCRSDQQEAFAAGIRSAAFLNLDERIDRALEEDVVPPAGEDAWRIDLVGMSLGIELVP